MPARRRISFAPSFSRGLYQWEHELFSRHFLADTARIHSNSIGRILRELSALPHVLMKQPYTLIHRDLQSSNVMVKRGRPIFIDFQGMRFGPALYDLASLVCDPYTALDEMTREKLIAHYAARTKQNEQKVFRLFSYAAVQRLVQALGAFGRIRKIRGMEHFAQYIHPALMQLEHTLSHLNGFDELKRSTRMLRHKYP